MKLIKVLDTLGNEVYFPANKVARIVVTNKQAVIDFEGLGKNDYTAINLGEFKRLKAQLEEN